MDSSVPISENPSCLHTTVDSFSSHSSSHTLPHCLFLHTSTLPSLLFLPPLSLTSPSSQGEPEPSFKSLTYYHNYLKKLLTLNCRCEGTELNCQSYHKYLCHKCYLLLHLTSVVTYYTLHKVQIYIFVLQRVEVTYIANCDNFTASVPLIFRNFGFKVIVQNIKLSMLWGFPGTF